MQPKERKTEKMNKKSGILQVRIGEVHTFLFRYRYGII